MSLDKYPKRNSKSYEGDRSHICLGKSGKTIWKVGIKQGCHIEIEFNGHASGPGLGRYRRMSAVNASGTWTLLGSLIFSSQKKSKPLGDEVEQRDLNI